jgi:hypothetical protein
MDHVRRKERYSDKVVPLKLGQYGRIFITRRLCGRV